MPLTMTADARTIGREYGEGPWNKQIDFRLEKGFEFAGLRLALFLDVINAFNFVNIVGYDNTTDGGESLGNVHEGRQS